MNKEVTKAVIYTRVSTNEQVGNYSLGFQEEECKRCAQKNGWKIEKIFREEGASAKTYLNRKKLLKLLRFCTTKKSGISRVLVYKLDRWSRDTKDGLTLMSMLAKQGVEVISVTEPSTDTAMGKAMKSMCLVMAELDNNIKSERTKDGMMAAFKAGRWPWKAPIGYKHVAINERKKLIFLTDFLPVFKKLFYEAGTGLYTKKELAKRMNKRGYRKLWSTPATTATVDKVIKNKFYCGIMIAKTWEIEKRGKHRPVVDEITWTKANSVLYRKPGLAMVTTSLSSHFPLRGGFLLCSSCRKPMTGSISRGRTKKYAYYHCMNKSCIDPDRIRKDTVEKLFIESLSQFKLSKVQSSF